MIHNSDVTALSYRQRAWLHRENVAIVFQRFHLLPARSARANVAFPLIEQGVPRRNRWNRVREILDTIGLGDRLDHRLGALRGGEQLRVAVARAFVTDPAVIVAD